MQMLPYFPPTTPRARLLAAGYSPLPPCPCGQRLFSRDRANGYSVRVEYADDTGQRVEACPGCGDRLNAAWVQRCGEWQERQRNQKAAGCSPTVLVTKSIQFSEVIQNDFSTEGTAVQTQQSDPIVPARSAAEARRPDRGEAQPAITSDDLAQRQAVAV